MSGSKPSTVVATEMKIGRMREIEPHRPGDNAFERFPRLVRIQRYFTAAQMRRVQITEDDIRVGDRRAVPALVIANRPGFGARAFRADAQRAAGVDPDDGPAPRPDLGEVDGGHLQQITRTG